MKKYRQSAIDRPFARRAGVCDCAHQGCAEEAVYKAPLSSAQPGRHQWFCLEHVRAFNSAWNACAGYDEDAIEALRRADSVWQRPSWPFGNPEGSAQATASTFHDPFGFMPGDDRPKGAKKAPSEAERALAVLGLGCTATLECVKTRYKELVKKLHPDANGSDRQSEDRLKAVNEAYATLKSSLNR